MEGVGDDIVDDQVMRRAAQSMATIGAVAKSSTYDVGTYDAQVG